MEFANPIMLAWALLALVAIPAAHALALRRGRRLLRAFASESLLARIAGTRSPSRTWAKIACVSIATALVLAALARPRWGVETTIEHHAGKPHEVVLAVDLSRSMLADDLKPSRLARTRFVMHDILGQLKDRRVGIVGFAGGAYTLCPPTEDADALRDCIENLSPDTMPYGGTDIGAAIDESMSLFSKDAPVKQLILFSDGEDLAKRFVESARAAAKDGLRIQAVGVGTPAGATITQGSGGQHQTHLDEDTLRRIAEATGGNYRRLDGAGTADALLAAARMLPGGDGGAGDTAGSDATRTIPVERYRWPLTIALVLLLAEALVSNRRPDGEPRRPSSAPAP